MEIGWKAMEIPEWTKLTKLIRFSFNVQVIATQTRTWAGVGMVLSSFLRWHCEALASSLHRLDPSVEVRLVDLMEPPYAAGAREAIASIECIGSMTRLQSFIACIDDHRCKMI